MGAVQGVSATHSARLPEIQLGQGVGAMWQVPRRPHTQFSPSKKQLRQSAGTDGAALFAAVEGREGRDPLKREGDGRPSTGFQVGFPGLMVECVRGRGGGGWAI